MIEPTLTSFVFLFSWFLNMQTCVLHFFWRFFWIIHLTWFVGAAVQLHLLFFIPFPFWNWRLRFEYALQTSKFNRLHFFCYLCIAHNLKVAVSSPAFVLVPSRSVISEWKMRVRGRKMHTLLSCMQSFLCDLSFISDFANSFDGILTI